MAVKVFPASEFILTFDTVEEGELNPCWFLYQPVSYKLQSRIGDKKQFKNMTNICKQHGVRVYSNVVINHMAGNGNDMYADHRNNAVSCVIGDLKQEVLVLFHEPLVGNMIIMFILELGLV